MLNFAKLPTDERDIFFKEVASKRNLTPLIVEKDFWVCFILRCLFTEPNFKDKFVFKGGTSLSKVFGIIKRFSEDIDLSVDPDWLGFGGENRPDKAKSNTQFNKRCKELESACITKVKEQVQPILENAISKVIGPTKSTKNYLSFNIDQQTKSPVLVFQYPTNEANALEYIQTHVKLELGSLIDQHPTGAYEITPWVAEEFPNYFKDPTSQVIALEAERTFWEKATILHAEYHRPIDKQMRNRLSRDCYDLCQMWAHESGQRAINNKNLRESVVRHKDKYFHSGWANYESAKPGTFRLVLPEHRLPDLKKDYKEMREMFFDEPPSIDELLNQLQEIEKKINNI